MNHQSESTSPQPMNRSFFERYQVFIALVVCGILVAAGIIISGLVGGGAVRQPKAQTAKQARKEVARAAVHAGIEKKAFETCVSGAEKVELVNSAIALADASGVTGTPTFFVLKRTLRPDKTVRSEEQIMVLGARDVETFLQVIEEGKAPADQPATTPGERIVLTENDHFLGPKDAEVVIVEYSDLDCPYCKRAKPIIDELLAQHPEFGFVYRHSPILNLHPNAGMKAAASECVSSLGGEEAFWKFINEVSD